MCILTFVFVCAVWETATATPTATPPVITTPTPTAATPTPTATATLTITNDSHSSHGTNVVSSSAMDRNEGAAKTLSEIQIGIVGALATSTTTSTAMPTTTTAAAAAAAAAAEAATATAAAAAAPTTAATATSATPATSISNGNEAGRQISNFEAATTTMDGYAKAGKEISTTETTAATAADGLMTTNVPPLASLGSIFDRLYRIKESSDISSSATPLDMQMQAAEAYQVAETLADLNEEERSRYGALLAQQPVSQSKLNIVDLYPVQLEDFQPRVPTDNVEVSKERTVFREPENVEQYRQNLMPNEVADYGSSYLPATTMKTATTPSVATTSSYFTGKLLAEQDDLITEIERKFQLEETTTTTAPTSTSSTRRTELPQLQPGDTYIDRRVKKSFEFPMQQQRASDVMALPHIDFANTKFNTDANDGRQVRLTTAGGAAGVGAGARTVAGAAAAGGPTHPEFSTTKFYNSKELYNEMLLHNKRKLMKEIGYATAAPIETASSIIKSSETMVGQSSEQQPRQVIRPSETTNLELSSSTESTVTTTQALPPGRRVTLTSTAQTFDGATAEAATATTTTATATTASKLSTMRPIRAGPELKRAKLLLKTLTPPDAVEPQSEKLEVVSAKIKITTTAAKQSPADMEKSSQLANLTKSSLKPIAVPRILSRLQEKINSLECDIQNVPQDSHLWRGNETHELLLPNVTPQHCEPDEPCTPNKLTWEGEADIQSGDILIVEINDAKLSTEGAQDSIKSQSAAHAAQVYQVTRSGHEHCDVTEGVLLDITPLVVDGRKLVTLYDKDLTEGVNLLIVVSELWGEQCVRLKVTTKTDNCGENADCSGKGVCYSNGVMEEYECQCCGGFAGPHCEEIDACNPSPCTNNGICVDLSQGHEGNSYQCLCPYGYAGKNCQYESDLCNPAECMNGGSCLGNSTHFRCDCAPGYTGPLCQHSLNECESSPCLHGICVDQEDGFRCFCQPGFAGELCNFEYNECESNPCQNSGECIDHIGSYECRCTKGYTGNRCQIKVDFCANKPCPEGHRCIDHGNDFSCECPGGRNGPDCNQMPRTYFQQCSVNPCTHGGTCWSSGDSFYCACRPGYTGTMCEDEFVVETVVSSSEFIVDDANARNFNDKTFSSSVVLKSPIELHNAYFAAGVLAAAIFIVAIVVTICHCNVNQTYRKFSTRSTSFIPILGFTRRPKMQGTLNKHWLSGKALNDPAAVAHRDASFAASSSCGGSSSSSSGNSAQQSTRHLSSKPNGSSHHTQTTLGGQLHERPFQRHLAMNMENDMYYTVDFSEGSSQQLPLIQ
ncbi:hypothetical protein AWZ03_008473 [Drosophila navojoa]|uniref:EGF-like domain-containing protein n=1 Tax=Drosophila navojoa TaxID=7232 RepID=A0A484BBI8_DRONA|nr:hypothetical protein AWZ03_008473 [Drosophila navojoa]